MFRKVKIAGSSLYMTDGWRMPFLRDDKETTDGACAGGKSRSGGRGRSRVQQCVDAQGGEEALHPVRLRGRVRLDVS